MLAELAAAVRARRVSPVELVEEALRRIERDDPALNAVVRLRAEEALVEARAHSGEGPLAGLPLLVKDMARCAGMPTTFGSTMFADAAPDTASDIVVDRLRAAGAIVIGKTNTPPFGCAAVTTNRLFGPTGNPWNPDRSPGGSSGGSAAALASGMVPLATTSDGGGSTRIPASACGLVGYKPSMGAIGRNFTPRWLNYSTMGVAGHSVADVALHASIVIGAAPGDVISLPTGSVSAEPVRPSRVVAVRSFRGDVDEVIENAFTALCDRLGTDAGLPVEWVDSPFPVDGIVSWFISSSAELAQSLSTFEDRWSEFEDVLREQLEFGKRVSAADYIAAQRQRYEQAARVDALLTPGTVLVVPTLNASSWPKDGPMSTKAGSTSNPSVATNTADLNFTGHPGVSVPLGIDASGVPFGVQVVGPRFQDGLAMGLAAVIEEIQPWPLLPPGYETFGSTFVGRT